MQAHKADIVFGFVLTAVSGLLLWHSLKIAVRFAGRFTPFYYTPGFVPLLLSASLIILAVTLIVLKRAAFAGSWTPRATIREVVTSRGLWAVLLIGSYVLLLPRVHFVVATAAFLFVTTMLFNPRHVLVSALVTFVATFGIYFVFARLFIISLP
jgi:putative tricarboxylic transport membrane protein